MDANSPKPAPFSPDALQRAIDGKTKPVGSLGRIEELAAQIGGFKQTCVPRLRECRLIIFAGDHGIAGSGVSAYPQEVTRQMVLNFLAGGAAANVFARALGADVQVVDAGIAGDPIEHPELIKRRLGPGTENCVKRPAMTAGQLDRALAFGRELGSVKGVDVLCLGDMGIGNTSAAALVCHKVLNLPLDRLTGRGTGLDDAGLRRKQTVLETAAARTSTGLGASAALREYAGFEMAMITGAMLGAAAEGTLVIVDGFIATAAAVAAIGMEPSSRDAMVFAHRSAEHGHETVVDALGVRPLLDLEMRLGEGTGALLAWPLVKIAAAMLCEMASFESARVSGPA